MMPYSFVIFQGVPNPLCPLWIRAWKELENNMLATWPETPHLKQSNQLSLSLSEMLAELNRAQSTALLNKDQNHTKNINNGTDIQKQCVKNNRTTALERIVAETTGRALIRMLPSDATPLIHMFVSSR